MDKQRGFGNYVKEKRRTLGLTLREFCRLNEFDPGNISRIERGLMAPARDRGKRLKYARALGIEENTDEWLEFCDLAEISANRIPEDIASDEEVLSALPIFFRSARGKKVTEEDLDKLIESIRKNVR